MQFIIYIICLIVFFFALYRLGRDDYVLIRKNISMEQLFDVGFLALLVGMVFARLLFLFFHPAHSSILLQFFTPSLSDISLSGVVAGGWLWTYLIGKYKRYPLGRIFDFLCLALLVILPIGFFAQLLFLKRTAFLLSSIEGGFYLILAILFWKILYPRLMSAKLREGIVSTLFLVCFTIVSLLVSEFVHFKSMKLVFTSEDYFLFGICLISVILLLRQERRGGKGKN